MVERLVVKGNKAMVLVVVWWLTFREMLRMMVQEIEEVSPMKSMFTVAWILYVEYKPYQNKEESTFVETTPQNSHVSTLIETTLQSTPICLYRCFQNHKFLDPMEVCNYFLNFKNDLLTILLLFFWKSVSFFKKSK